MKGRIREGEFYDRRERSQVLFASISPKCVEKPTGIHSAWTELQAAPNSKRAVSVDSVLLKHPPAPKSSSLSLNVSSS